MGCLVTRQQGKLASCFWPGVWVSTWGQLQISERAVAVAAVIRSLQHQPPCADDGACRRTATHALLSKPGRPAKPLVLSPCRALLRWCWRGAPVCWTPRATQWS